MPNMPRLRIATGSSSLPDKAGVLLDYHAELILELIAQRADNNAEGCEMIYAELEMIELAIADLEAKANRLKPPRMWM
jgi:hypothetical protein